MIICYVIGDIEGNYTKLQYFTKFIDDHINDDISFVFMGDLIDDISDDNPEKERNWSCLYLIVRKYIPYDIVFKDDDDNECSDPKAVSLKSFIEKFSFRKKKYNEIGTRVMFIAGNSECDILNDLKKYRKEGSNYIIGDNKYKKKLTFEQMCVLLLYLNSCYGVITLEDNNNKIHPPGFKQTVYFRHSIKKFDKYHDILEQNTNATEQDLRDQNFLFIAGHSKLFTLTGPKDYPNSLIYYIIDTSTVKGEDRRSTKYYPRAIRGGGTNDHRMAVISYDDEKGYSIAQDDPSSNFYIWSKRFSSWEVL